MGKIPSLDVVNFWPLHCETPRKVCPFDVAHAIGKWAFASRCVKKIVRNRQAAFCELIGFNVSHCLFHTQKSIIFSGIYKKNLHFNLLDNQRLTAPPRRLLQVVCASTEATTRLRCDSRPPHSRCSLRSHRNHRHSRESPRRRKVARCPVARICRP